MMNGKDITGGTGAVVRMGRSAYLLSAGGILRVRKYQPPVGSTASRISRLIFGGSLPFRNEKRVMRLMSGLTFDWLRYPMPIAIAENDYVEYEYIGGEDVMRMSDDERMAVLKALHEFGTLGLKYRVTGLEGIALRLLESPVIRTMRCIIRSDITRAEKWSALVLLLRAYLRRNRARRILLHNDLMFSNLRRGDDGYIYFIDFEDSIPESFMILADAVDLLLKRDACEIDIPSLRSYWRELSYPYGISGEEDEFKEQVRICLLRLSVAGRSRILSAPDERSAMDALFRIVIDDDKYEKWYEIQSDRGDVRHS